MGTQSLIQRTFAAGELAPVLVARADTAKYLSGLKICHNFIVRREGGVTSRPGFRYIGPTADNATGKKLLRYLGSTASTGVLIEAGAGYFRFYYLGSPVLVAGVPAYNGATAYVPGDLVVAGGVNYYCFANTTGNAPPNAAFWHPLTGTTYEIPTPYGGVVPIFKWYQSGNVIVITQQGQVPRELIFAGLTRWVLRDVSTSPSVLPPTGVTATPGAPGALNYAYVVTRAAADSFEESNPSSAAPCASCVTPTVSAPNAVHWTADPSTPEWYVYCDPYGNGVFGFIGTATSNHFNDTGFVPDFTLTPPQARILFDSTDNYPDNAATYQQRRFYANTNAAPDTVDGSRIGFAENFGISSPVQDDDAVEFELAGNGHHPVRAMVALTAGLVLLTDGGEWTVTGGAGPMTPITPSSIAANQVTYVGVDPSIRPVVVGAAIIYLQARGSILRELSFSENMLGGLVPAGRDLTVFASHLFEGFTILAQDFQQVPDSIVWCVRSDGVLLGLTYVPDQDVWGWHHHDTIGGLVEDICVVPETTMDVLYLLVNRGGVRQIEKLESRILNNFNHDAFFVDSGLSYHGAPATVFSGLDHLNGKLVACLADGVVLFNGDPAGPVPLVAQFTVTAGAVTLTHAASDVHIGLPIQFPEVETLDLDQHGTQIRDVKKRVGSVALLVDKSGRTFLVGPDSTHTVPYQQQTFEPAGPQFSGLLEIGTVSTFDPYGRVYVRQVDPVPLTILGIVPNVQLGG